MWNAKAKKQQKETRRLDLRDTLICFFKEDHVVLSFFFFLYFPLNSSSGLRVKPSPIKSGLRSRGIPLS